MYIVDVYRADSLLGVISQRTSLGLDVRLERNVCALLLGNVQHDEGAKLPETSATEASDLRLTETEGPLGSTNGGVEVMVSRELSHLCWLLKRGPPLLKR